MRLAKTDKRSRRVLSWLLCVCMMVMLCLPGCGRQDTGGTESGSNMETGSGSREQSSPEESSLEKPSESESESESEPESESEQPQSDASSTGEYDEDGYLISPCVVYATAVVNVRTMPSTENSEVIDKLPVGYPVNRTAYTEEWTKIDINGEIYYVSTAFLSETKQEASSSQETAPESTSQYTPVESSESAGESNGFVICIDAGHQEYGISEKEPNGPGSTEMKAKLTTGTAGVVTGKAEYQLNLEVSLLLRDELVRRGYEVIMIRETNSCPMSNAERAVYANESGADLFVRIHANSSTDPEMNGALTMAPSSANPYVSYLAADSIRLSQNIVDGLCTATGARNIGVLTTDTMTGINWCTIPVSIVEMGYMSNPTEDAKLSDPAYQALIVKGIADGIDIYTGQ